ncbi:hypothetical protein [Alicyclobacillus fructus]|nr:hypothetical protein [Alicyclobacillus fructus]
MSCPGCEVWQGGVTLRVLLELGYTWQQGYLYARPSLEVPDGSIAWLPRA